MTAKPKTGRPSKFRQEFIAQAKELALLGLTDDEMARVFGVSLYDLACWAFHNEEFYVAITPSAEDIEKRREEISARNHRRASARKSRIERSPHERIANSMRARMWAAIKGISHKGLLSKLGYDVNQLKDHLESLFSDGMTWENYGKWHIDHIRPCSSFDLGDDRQFSECWSMRNLQPLWASENIRKGAKYGSP